MLKLSNVQWQFIKCLNGRISDAHSLSTIRENFKPIHPYMILIQGIRIIFIDQLPNLSRLKKVHFMLASKFSKVYHLV